jgi:transposase
MVRPAAPALSMSSAQRESLAAIARSQSAPHRQVQRARALLLAADGEANRHIAECLGVAAGTVRSWRERFAEEGLAKLGEVRADRGRKPTIGDEKVAEIVDLTLHSKPEGHTHWSCRTMAEHVGVSPATVQRIWGRSRAQAASGRYVQAARGSAVLE